MANGNGHQPTLPFFNPAAGCGAPYRDCRQLFAASMPFIIIAAGHNSKVVALGLLAPVIAGFYLIFQKKYAFTLRIRRRTITSCKSARR